MKLSLLCTLLATLVSTIYAQGYGNYGHQTLEEQPHKLRFNIGFNVPSMSISLPKLELPQISIKASIKQKKPFQLRLPRITFNSHVSATEDEEEPAPAKPAYGGNSYGGGSSNSYSGGNSNSYSGGASHHGGSSHGGDNNAQAYGAAPSSGGGDYPGGYRAASNERPHQVNHHQYQQNFNEEPQFAQGSPVPNYQGPMAGYNEGGYATGFQGRSISDYKSSATNNGYYAPPAPFHGPTNNAQPNNYGARMNNYQRRDGGGHYRTAASEVVLMRARPNLDLSKWTPIAGGAKNNGLFYAIL